MRNGEFIMDHLKLNNLNVEKNELFDMNSVYAQRCFVIRDLCFVCCSALLGTSKGLSWGVC